MNTDKIIEDFMKTRIDKDELKVLRQRPSMLGDLLNFANEVDKELNRIKSERLK